MRRELWLLEDGTYLVAARPPEYEGLHFGPTLRAYLLDQHLARLHEHKDEQLLVLRRLEVPLHTNQSETDIRDYVKKREVSGGTRSDLGGPEHVRQPKEDVLEQFGGSFGDYLPELMAQLA